MTLAHVLLCLSSFICYINFQRASEAAALHLSEVFAPSINYQDFKQDS